MNRLNRNSSKDSDYSQEDTTFDSDSSSRNSFNIIRSRRLYKSADNTSCSGSIQSDSSLSDTKIMKTKQRNKKRHTKQLPPIGVFWDIENCHVPKNKSAVSIVKRIREFFFHGYREAEFMIVCDVKKESAEVIQDLHDAQVNLIHVSSTSKNAADEKLRQSLRRFAEIFPPPSAVILISSDINFASDLSDLRYRKKLQVILIHKSNVADALMLCANETYHFSIFTDNLPYKKPKNPSNPPLELMVSNLPQNVDKRRIRARLKLLSNNCGGKVVTVDCNEGMATIKFPSEDFLVRAQKRLKGEDVYGCKINVNPTTIKNVPCKSITGAKMKNSDFVQLPSSSTTSTYFTEPNYYHVDSSGSIKSDSILAGSEELFRLNQVGTRAIKGAGSMLSTCNEWRTSPQENLVNSTQKTDSLLMSTDTEDSAIYQERCTEISTTEASDVVELSIKNLDNSFHVTDIKRILCNQIKQHVMIVSMELIQTDDKLFGILKVKNQYDAQIVITKLHRMKLGNRRILVSCAQINCLSATQLEDMVIPLLQESPGKQMLLFKLLDLLEFRYHINVSLSELNKLKSVCKITEKDNGRVISLVSDIRKSSISTVNGDYLYCPLHYPQEFQNVDWNALGAQLPYVIMPLKLFAEKLNNLLDSHMGTLPFLSLQHCYEYQFGTPLTLNDNGIPLEHLVTCVSNVELRCTGPNRSIKYIKRETTTTSTSGKQNCLDYESLSKVMPSTIASDIRLLGKEVLDLLKTRDRSQLLFNKFIPTYHHHFTRQCKVSDYGYTKLIDLLESPMLSNYIQVLGHGSCRIITLRHTIQMKRFMSDVRRILKSQTSNKITLREFPINYERIFSKTFNPIDYGLCSLEDLLYELSENHFNVTWNTCPVTISISKKQYVGKEILSIQAFAEQVVILLCNLPCHSVLFDKFVPAYHHHFGYQCKISHYGFSKLIELFEAIPDTVKIESTAGGERLIRLMRHRAMDVLGNRLLHLIKGHEFGMLPLESLQATYLQEYGYALKPSTYEHDKLDDLLKDLKGYVKIVETLTGTFLISNDGIEMENINDIHIWSVLIEPPYHANIEMFCNKFRLNFNSNIALTKLKEHNNVVEVINQNNETIIKLMPLYVFAAEIYKMLFVSGGRILLKSFESKYESTFTKNLDVNDFGANSLIDLLHMIDFTVTIIISWNRLTVQLNENLSEFGVPLPLHTDVEENVEALWPPPPTHVTPYNFVKFAPPKPDTPTNDTACGFTWNTPERNEMSFQIDLPRFVTPKHIGDPYTLVSPTSIFARDIRCVSEAPHPANLPMPDKLLANDINNDDSHDSGLANNSNGNDSYYLNDRGTTTK